MYLVISSSLKPKSLSRIMASRALQMLNDASVETQFLDLQDQTLPFCDGGACYGDPNVQEMGKLIGSAKAVLIATPIYNFDVNSAMKNLVELTGKDAWQDKVVAFICAAGGGLSYMSIMPFANSLMLDFRCLIIPRFVFATGQSFDDGVLNDEAVENRLAEVTSTLVKIASAI